jgi:RNA-directed DNA polymerase
MKQEDLPLAVPATAKQDGEAAVSERWSWVEPAAWTPRMLHALEQGVKGGVWYSLMDKVYAFRNLQAATKRVVANRGSAGIDHVSVNMFERNRDANLQRLCEQLREGRYYPQAVRRTYIPKPGSRELRPLGIPTVRDRIAQTALRNVLEPIFERDFAEHSYGFRPGRGCKDALRRVSCLLSKRHLFVVDVDLKSFFDTIPHEQLLARVEQRVADSRVLDLVRSYLKQRVLDTMQEWQPEQGTPQGAVISPLLANIYLDPLDHLMASRGFEMTRYADDMVIQCRDEQHAQQAMDLLREWVEKAGLSLHPTKTRIVQVTEMQGFDFLGYHFQLSKGPPIHVGKRPRDKSLRKFKDSVRDKTHRCNGHSLEAIIRRLNPALRGFLEYFKHGANIFARLDSWVRGRLRAILRKRTHRQGRANGKDHQRWANAFFREHGLLSMVEERARLVQSSG